MFSGCSSNEPSAVTTSESTSLSNARPVLPASDSLIPVNGKGRYFIGANYPWHRYGDDFGGTPESSSRDWSKIQADFNTMHEQGVEIVRMYIFADGRSEPKFDSQGYVTGVGPMFYSDFDKMLKIAADCDISLVLTLCDSSMYRFYPDPVTHGGGHARIVLENQAQQSFLKKALKPLLVHVANSPYKSTVNSIDLINEPEGCTAGFYAAGGIGRGAMKSFILVEAEYVHTYAPGVFATVGSATPTWVNTWKGIGLDYYCTHYYPDMDGRDVLAGTLPPGNGLPQYSVLGLDRACVLEEFATHDSDYNPVSKKPLSGRWYLDQIRARGYAGALAWSYTVPDNASDWKDFAPTYEAWYKKHEADLSKPLGQSSKR